MANRKLDVDVIVSDGKQVDKPEEMKPEEIEEIVAEPVVKPASVDNSDETRPDNPIVFRHPVLINGEERKTLAWSEDISSEQFLQADSLAHGSRASVTVAEMDTGLHFWLGVMMICAANPEVDPKDMEQIKGKDNVSVMRVGRFLMLDSED